MIVKRSTDAAEGRRQCQYVYESRFYVKRRCISCIGYTNKARIEDYGFMGWIQRSLVDTYQSVGGISPS